MLDRMSNEGHEVVFPIYPGVTQLDFTGPHQVFSRLPGAVVRVASVGGRDVEADGLVFTRLADLDAIARCDVLCVPGGYGTADAILDEAYLGAIRRLAASARLVTSVCTGSLVLGAAGLLRGRHAATHWAWRELLARFGAIVDEARVVRDGNVLTGGGVTAGIDLALAAVAELAGLEAAQAIQLALEYAPAPPFDAGRPESAPDAILSAVRARIEAARGARREAIEEAARRLGHG